MEDGQGLVQGPEEAMGLSRGSTVKKSACLSMERLGGAPERTLDPSGCQHLHPGLREGSTVSFVILPSWLWNSQK